MGSPLQTAVQLDLFGPATTHPPEPAKTPPAPEPKPPALEPAPPIGPAPVADRSAASPLDPQQLRQRLRQLTGDRVQGLVLTDNKTRIVSARPTRDGGLDVRIHRCFADADAAVLRAVADFLLSRRRSPKRSRALVKIREHFADHAASHAQTARKRRRPSARRQPVGEALDLRVLRDQINHDYFGGQVEVDITWGRALPAQTRRRGRQRRRRGCGFSIRLGSYDQLEGLVRIHRCLDRTEVPRYVVEAVVYHEMLHAVLPPEVRNGRRRVHTPEFRRRERLFEHHRAAERWIDDNLERLAAIRDQAPRSKSKRSKTSR